jgi:hypothetical protein
MDAAETEELQRLRRQLRAQSAVNRQLHAQLDGGTVRVAASGRGAGEPAAGEGETDSARSALTVRRVTEGGPWIEQLLLYGGGDPFLVRTPTKGVYVVDGDMRRQVKAGLLAAALTRVLGAPRELGDHELQRWSTGPPVEVMESGTGPAFLIIGGRRLPLRGVPLPYLVSTEDMLLFPEGEELNVSVRRTAPQKRSARARRVLRNEGPARGVAKLLRKAWKRLRR